MGSLVISLFVVFWVFHSRSQPSGIASTPPPVPVALAAEPAIVTSPDGKMSLTMKQNKINGATTYTFLMTDNSNNLQKEIFTKTEANGVTLSIPNNAFSPDNKYVFLKETGGKQMNYFILSSTLSSDSNVPIEVSDLTANYQDFVITDVTGWGGIDLLIINTDKAGGGVGPSFWFDVKSNSFIRLSTRFN